MRKLKKRVKRRNEPRETNGHVKKEKENIEFLPVNNVDEAKGKDKSWKEETTRNNWFYRRFFGIFKINDKRSGRDFN